MSKGFLFSMLTRIFGNFGTVFLVHSTDDICFSYSATAKAVVWRYQHRQPQLDSIHGVLKLYFLDQANVLQLTLCFQAHVVSATGTRTFSLYLERRYNMRKDDIRWTCTTLELS